MAANVYASATEDDQGPWTSGSVTIDCPDVGSRLTSVPDGAGEEVDRELALLDQQIAAAYQQLQGSAQAVRDDAGFADNAVMNPLKEKRAATLERIGIAIDRVADRPEGLSDLAACTLRTADDNAGEEAGGNGGDGQDQGDGQNQGDGQQGGDGQQDNGGEGDGQQGDGGNGGQAGNGPVAADFVDITTVQPAQQAADLGAGPSQGTFATSCGVNANGLFNSDNVIVAPGVTNGAHHFHDYVGNQANDAFASDDDLANGETTCVDQGDKSTYYWPVLRLQNGTQEQDAQSPGGGIEGNAGEIVTPKEVTLTFVGNARSEVTAMPRLLRIITGDAKAFVNGTANANASWSCTGFEDRQLKDKYPLCPNGSDVVRSFSFQSCWDGNNIDSANHRTHVAFAAADGSCPAGFKAIPQLVQRIVYDVDAPSLQDGGRTTPLFAVDSFPEQLHKPVTDHGDFINVFDENLMNEMVDCINEGRTCGAGGDNGGGDNGGGDNGGGDNGGGDNGGGDNAGGDNAGGDNGGGAEQPGQEQGQGDGQEQPPAENPEEPQAEPAAGGAGSTDTPRTAEPRVYTKPSAKATEPAAENPAKDAPAQDAGAKGEIGTPATADPDEAPNQNQNENPAPDQSPVAADTGDTPSVVPAPQAQGGLAETGANLWPAAAGALLLIGGFVVLRRSAKSS
ncbi:DUF1996 domain-containing protein [Streptomyces sp. ID05-47C]|uniref:DUF1996 domain-containing protein n=1 Tax=Streptomyces sp. ID05-47C TaxID=3028665 RepID=UPI0029A4B3DE|nr:DUF1996 domain-containing protein [Streptomyces sp. ID05-47C]MDX3574158.1 DUF1996 domain-containing protein [Streptomyces sp. ID05-47C]